jgi:hypothetical protein
LLQTDSAGTGVEWASNIDVPGTLDVTGATTLDNTLTVTGDANFDSGTLFVDESQSNVGIKRTSTNSNFALDINGRVLVKDDASSGSVFAIDSTSGRGGAVGFYNTWPTLLNLFGNSGTIFADASTDATVYATSGNNVRLYAGGSESMRIDSSGRVGIGTTSPGSFDPSGDNLVVGTTSGSNGITIAAGPTNGSSLYFADGTTGAQRYAGLISYDHNSDRMSLFTAALERVRIDSSGNVGINTTSPATTLHVAGDVTFGGAIDETVYNLTGTALDPANGTIQYITLSANTTFTDSIAEGESMTLMIDDGTAYTVTWPTTTWVNNAGAAPTLATTGYTVVVLWKVSTTLYGALVGDGS